MSIRFNCLPTIHSSALIPISKMALAGVMSTFLITAQAQGPIQYGPGSERLPLPKFETPEDEPDFVLPEVKPPEKTEQVQDALRVFVKRFELSGNKVYSYEELHPIISPYEGRELTTAEIQEARRNLTLFYVNNGYINSGAILPNQKVTDGIIKLQIIEGELTTVEVSGNEDLKSSYISDRLELGGGPPLNLKEMQQQLRMMQQDPLIKKINAELLPGSKPGESVLKVLVEEDEPRQFAVFFDNHQSPSVGSFGLGVEGLHRNLTGHGDAVQLRYVQTEGMKDLNLSYTIPLTARDTKLRFHYEGTNSKIIEKPFDIIDVTSKSRTFGVELTHPFYRTPNEEFILGLGVDLRKNQTYLLGEPFSFSLGEDDGKSRVSVVRFSQVWNKRLLNTAFSVRSVFSFGIDAWNASVYGSNPPVTACGPAPVTYCPDGDFVAWLGQFQFAHRFSAFERLMRFVFRADAQFTDDPLLPMEKFSIGGHNTVRGYRENQLVRDNGVVMSAELHIPVFRNPDGGTPFRLVPFFDYGHSWNEDISTPNPHTITSAGVGIIWEPNRHLHAELFLAEEFRNIVGESEEHDLQDSGIQFRVSYSFF
jgi:hemolysin activation/secretion protein